MMAYEGAFEILDDEDFHLYAEHLVINENEISFSLSGVYESEKLTAAGTARRKDHTWLSLPFEVRYSGYGVKANGEATIEILRIEFSPKKHKCMVSGRWIEGRFWSFRGNLRKIGKAK
jgi:hypothetical protein